MRIPATLSGLAMLVAAGAAAQSTPEGLQPVPEPPPPPERVESGEPLEPDVRIVREDGKTVTEYRVNGRLTAIKVEPDGFPAYYLIDTDGDGKLETRSAHIDRSFIVPQWAIFSW